jgi:hypothetical protein
MSDEPHLSEHTCAIKRHTEAVLGLGRLVGANGWELEKASRATVKATRDAAESATRASLVARSAEAAVNVFAEEQRKHLVYERKIDVEIEMLAHALQIILRKLDESETADMLAAHWAGKRQKREKRDQ